MRRISLAKPAVILRPGLLAMTLVAVFLPFAGFAAEDNASIYFSHALKSKAEGRALMAERLFRKAIELQPDNADYHFELGNLYLERNNLSGARMELEQTTMIDPLHLPAHYNLGLVYRETGWMGEARQEFRRVLELDPQNVKAQLQIGYTYQAENFTDEARDAFHRAREMDLSDPEPERALEDLDQYEQEARARNQQSMEQSLSRNQQFLGFGNSSNANPQQGSGQQALIQAGALLIQRMMSRNSQKENEGN